MMSSSDGVEDDARMAAGALDGLVVLDLSRALAGPYAAMVLGDLGAEVIKIESPGLGDTTRGFPPFWQGESTYYLSANRNKRSLVVDLTTPAGQQIVRELARGCDVLIESFRTGAMERWGLGWETLRAIQPRMIYCAVSAAGRSGPDRDRPGVDLLMQAHGGLMSVTGDEGGDPVRIGVSIVDLSTGANAVQGILAALLARERSGEGQRVDVSLLGSAVALLSYHVVAHVATGEVPRRLGSHHPSVHPYGAYPTRDGFIVLTIAFESHWQAFCEAVERPEWRDDVRFASNAARIAHRDLLDAEIAAALAPRDANDWVERLAAAQVPASVIRSVAEVVRDPQVEAMGYLERFPHPESGTMAAAATPFSLSDHPASVRRPPPRHGEHTREILQSLGYADAEVDRLVAAGVVEEQPRSPCPQ